MKPFSHLLIFTLECFALACFSLGCTSNSEDIWIYTSLYKDTVTSLEKQLSAAFPRSKFRFYQAGSEEIAAKFNIEAMAGKPQADLLISSDRFWYEDLATQGKLLAYVPQGAEKVDLSFRNYQGFYSAVSFPLMVLAYNSSVLSENEAPKSFKELTDPKWKGKLSMPSPLASGTAFTSVAFLKNKYGWDYFKALRKNDLIAEGGNSGVIRRLQSKERPVGIVLLENLLRLQKKDERIKIVYPEDGAIIQTNILAITQKARKDDVVRKVADWMFSNQGQMAMRESFMYAAVPGLAEPEGAREFKPIFKASPPWSSEFVSEILKSREDLKEEFSKIIF